MSASSKLNVEIRPYRLQDAGGVVEAALESVAEIQLWMPWRHSDYSLKDARAWLELQVPAFEARTAFELAIVSTDGRYVGGCGLNQIDADNQRANLGYWVRSTATKRGVATFAVSALRNWAFTHTGLIRLEIVIATGNVHSQRVAAKAGAVQEGTLNQRLLLHGAAHDAIMFSFTRSILTALMVDQLPNDAI